MKVHCHGLWREISTPGGAGGASKEGESSSARARAVGEGTGVC